MTDTKKIRVGAFHDLTPMRHEMERTLRQVFGDHSDATGVSGFTPALDIEEDEDAFVLHVELPGIDPEQVEVTLEGDLLVVLGERRFYDDKASDGFRRVERQFGRFRRAVRLPDRVDVAQVEATYRDGLLTVTVPKAEDAKPHRITVTAA